MKKQYFADTKGYKIDIFINDVYFCSTTWSKTCKEARQKFLEKHPKLLPGHVTCHFDKK
jgi:hypothetical protein